MPNKWVKCFGHYSTGQAINGLFHFTTWYITYSLLIHIATGRRKAIIIFHRPNVLNTSFIIRLPEKMFSRSWHERRCRRPRDNFMYCIFFYRWNWSLFSVSTMHLFVLYCSSNYETLCKSFLGQWYSCDFQYMQWQLLIQNRWDKEQRV